MPINPHYLDESLKDQDITKVIGEDVLSRIFERPRKKKILNEKQAKELLSIEDLSLKKTQLHIDEIRRLIEEEKKLTIDFVKEDVDAIQNALAEEGRSTVNTELLPGTNASGRRMWRISWVQTYKDDVPLLEKDIRGRLTKYMECQLIEKDKDIVRHESELRKLNPELKFLKPISIPLCPKCHTPFFDNTSDVEREKQSKRIAKKESKKAPPTQSSTAMVLQLSGATNIKKVLWGELKEPQQCELCNNLVFQRNAATIPLHEIDPAISDVLSENLWFEEYIAVILRELDFETWTSPDVKGASGIRHEMDVLAIKNGSIVCAECKNADIKGCNKIMTFSQKCHDIGSHLGLIALTGNFGDTNVGEFVRKDATLYPLLNLRDKPKKEIISELEKSPIGKI